MVSAQYSAFMRGLADYHLFLEVLSASEDQLEKQRHMEYVSRFLVHTYVNYDGKLDVEEFIDNGIVELASKGETQEAGATFRATFDLLYQAHSTNALRRFVNDAPVGRVSSPPSRLSRSECQKYNQNNCKSKPERICTAANN